MHWVGGSCTLSGQNDFPGLFWQLYHVYFNEKQFNSIYLHEYSEDKYSRVCTAELVEFPRLLEAVSVRADGQIRDDQIVNKQSYRY